MTPREAEAARAAFTPRGPAVWERLAPWPIAFEEPLRSLGPALDAVAAAIDEDERAERYPARAVAAARRAGVADLLAEPPEGPAPDRPLLTLPHLCALNVVTARRATSVGITLGVNTLALLPVVLGASPPLLRRVHARVREDAFCSMLLTELAHGSNLLRGEVRAERGVLGEGGRFEPVADGAACTHYRLQGEKDLINGGIEHALLITLARTRAAPADGTAEVSPIRVLGDFTLFAVERDARTVGLPRWRTLPAQAADISGVRFEGRVVSKDDVIGEEGGGFRLVRRTLTLSRGGIAALASGTTSRARELALAYARVRDVWGAPIVGLDPIAEHLMRLEALDRVVAAISIKAAAAANAHGTGAAVTTGVAKVAGCLLAEEAVREGARLVGGRGLLRDHPYERVSRDVLLYGVFDGTSHVVLDELQAKLDDEATRLARGEPAAVADTLASARATYGLAPRRAVEHLRGPAPAWTLPPVEHLRALAALPGEAPLEGLAGAAEALLRTAAALRDAGRWRADAALRQQAAEAWAELEAVVAGVELCDLDRRAALGLPPVVDAGPVDRLAWRYAAGWLGARLVDRVRALAQGAGLPAPPGLEELSRSLLRDHDQVRRDLRTHLRGGGSGPAASRA